jgi:hypothetical protein
MTDRVSLLIQAAREVRSAELRDKLLEAVQKEVEFRGRPRRRRLNPALATITFPLPIHVISPDGRRVEATLFEDQHVEMDGKVYSRPSSDDLMEAVGFTGGNAWGRWKFSAPDANDPSTIKDYPIRVLKNEGLI